MSNIWIIIKNELKQQKKRKVIYIAFILILIFVNLDVCPLMYKNKEQILKSVDFKVYSKFCDRVSNMIGVFYYLIIIILAPNRVLIDEKSECIDIIMASPISKTQYIIGKIFSNVILFSVLSFFTMIITVVMSVIFNPTMVVQPIYIIFYYFASIELTVIFAVIVSMGISILTKNSKMSSFICIAYLTFSLLSKDKDISRYFVIFGGKYAAMIRYINEESKSQLIYGFQNLGIIVAFIVAIITLVAIRNLRSGERKI